MATNTTLADRWQYRLLATLIGGSIVLALVIASATVPAQGQTGIEMGELQVADVNETATGDVSDVAVSADLSYQYDVPDAERRIIHLKAGPSADQLETLTFVQDDSPTGTDSGTVSLSGSLTETDAFAAEDFNPPLAESRTRDIVVAAVIEVRRAGGDPVTTTVTDTVSVTVHDGATLSATVGGTGTVSVSTA